MRRVEDPALVTGAARFTDDVPAERALHAVFVRSIWAHARVLAVENGAATRAPGVAGVFTAADLRLGRLPKGGGPEEMRRPVLAGDTVRFLGEPVAVVVAESLAAAVDAAELVEVGYEPLEVVVDPLRALDEDAPGLFGEHGSNLAAAGTEGAAAAGDGAGSAAGGGSPGEVVVAARLRNQRVAPLPLEPGGALAEPGEGATALTLWTGCQVPFQIRDTVAQLVGLPAERVRVRVPAVGGAFGGRAPAFPEQVVVAALALRLRRPVRYTETRSETMLAMPNGRGQEQEVELAAAPDGTLTRIKARVVADCGAYPAHATSMPELTGLMCCGVYRLPHVDFAHRCAVTNTPPVGIYRGAGRPEATALLERMIDLLAGRLGLDPAELRRRNLIGPGDFPYTTPTGACYDSGDYPLALEQALHAAGYEGLRAEQAARRRSGDTTQLGIGLCCYVEWTGFGSERARCSISGDGEATIVTGTAPHGQGHETTWALLAAEELGVAPETVRVVHSDTALTPRGPGTMGSRSLQVGGTAVAGAARKSREQACRLAAHLLEADVRDIVTVRGRGLGVIGATGRALTWAELARAANDPEQRPPGVQAGLEAHDEFAIPDATYPFGAHVAVVEVDTETGATELVRYVSVDDAGRIVNPPLAEGQIHGGIAQGVAQALFEEMAFDEDGNCVTGSLVSYGIPSAAELPSFETARSETPTARNPLGAKGIGESGAIGATPAVWNAVIDAVGHLGVTHIDMPLTPERVWRAIRAAG